MHSKVIMKRINWPKIDANHLIVTSNQMLDFERELFVNGMPEEALMEKVGINLSKWLLNKKKLLKGGVIVFIGPGHNGGDGAVIARELYLRGIQVKIYIPLPIKKILTSKHIKFLTFIGVETLNKLPDPEKHNLWIDALLGNNQKNSFDKETIKLFNIKFDNKFGHIISIDVPTGLCPNSGIPLDKKAIKANFTLSVGLKKIGILQDQAIPFVGKIRNFDIGIPKKKLIDSENKILSISNKDIHKLTIQTPPKKSSKYERGRTLIIAGSHKYPGAAYLTLKGAMASGVGYINALLPEVVTETIWQVAPEIVISGCLGKTNEGNSLIYPALKNLDLSRFESILIGPGIGLDIADWERSVDFLIDFKGLLILDADALNRISNSEIGCNFFLKRGSKTWITPHKKEFYRLFPHLDAINNIELALKAAKQFNVSIALKCAHSIVASNNKAWQIFSSDPECARAGLGDLLSGFVAGISAFEISSSHNISTESFAKYVLLHAFAASCSPNGSNASYVSEKLSKIVRNKKRGQMS